MEPAELFNHLESNQPDVVDDAKKKLHQIFYITKESWLLNGLFDYYLLTNSARAIEIMVSIREPHDKYLFDRLCDCLKSSASKLQGLTVLGHVLRRQPAWLYKICHHQLLKDLLKLLKTETDILPLLSALLVIVVLLPMIPVLVGPFLHDIFEIFSRLAAWNCNPGKLAEEQLVHLQVAMYALFLLLYGMFPCHFLAYLRNHYRQGDNMPVFMHTVKPMLGTVKIHPHLVTATKDNETDPARWKKKGHHDVIVECEKFAIEMSGSGIRDESCYTGLTSSFRSRSSTVSTSAEHPLDVQLHQSLKFAASATLMGAEKDLWSPTTFFRTQQSSSPPPVSEVCAPTSVPQTPNSQIPSAQAFAVFPHQEGTSPPEAAIEATPETTPIKDPRQMMGIGRVPLTSSTNVARALNTFSTNKWSSASTPNQSQPSSPMRKEPSPFRFPAEGSAFELSAATRREAMQSSHSQQKLFRMIQDRSQAIDGSVRGKTPVPTSPLRVISTTGSVPHSPVPLVDGPEVRDWSVAKPRPQRNGVSLTLSTDASQEDQEVLEIVGQAEMQMQVGATRAQFCDSVLYEFAAVTDDEFEAAGGECYGETHEQHQGSPCTSGGLHMPNSESLQAFATRIKRRLRYYSQCANVHDYNELSVSSSPNRTAPLHTTVKVRRANSCPEMKKNYSSPHVSEPSKTTLDESDEFYTDPTASTQPLANGVYEPLRQMQVQTVGTQTLDLWPMPYEHLFLGMFPLLEMNAETKPNPSPSPSPLLLFDRFGKFTPYEMLDKYIEQASFSYEHDGKRNKVHSLESEIKHLREQLSLLHLQLQYERHRREIHAMRNRRLLGESRNNKALEEHNSALKDQVSLLQIEIEHLNNELNTKKQESDYREKELQEIINYWHEQCLKSEELNKSLRIDKETVLREYTSQVERTVKVELLHQNAEAELFHLNAAMSMALEKASQCERLRMELEHAQRELLLIGELNVKYQERLAHWPLMEHRHEETQHLADAYHEEIRVLQQQLAAKSAMIEAQKAHIQELEKQCQVHDDLSTKQKRTLETVKDEYYEQLRSIESKYETQRLVNRSMEERILELLQRIETLSRTRGVHSPDTSSCHEAGAATSAAAGLSPHSSPLSASLASSDGSMAFLHTQQQDVKEIKNLQVIVDQSERCPQPRQSFEETTPPCPSD